jgi:hypothetical protein
MSEVRGQKTEDRRQSIRFRVSGVRCQETEDSSKKPVTSSQMRTAKLGLMQSKK